MNIKILMLLDILNQSWILNSYKIIEIFSLLVLNGIEHTGQMCYDQ